MKIKGRAGQFAFKALISITRENKLKQYTIPGEEWKLTDTLYFSLEDAESMLGKNIRWPAEEFSPGCIYIASEEELNEEE